MAKIRVKNIGAIRDGFQENDGWLDIKKITLFIGNQGSGKSTMAKLISTFAWLEKALVRGKLSEKEVIKYNRFVRLHCAYHNIQNYFNGNLTEINYEGDVYDFEYKNGKLTIQKNQKTAQLNVPKIMYVPAERNFLSVIKFRNLQKLGELPASIFTFLEELDKAQQATTTVSLPINNTSFKFDKLNQIAYIERKDSKSSTGEYRIKLSEASSGFQSFVPLFLVSQYLAASISEAKNPAQNTLSLEIQEHLNKEIQTLLEDMSLDIDIKRATLRAILGKYTNTSFLNIVEEPEQNLYPTSQRQILYKLLEFANKTPANGLIITTHSPYIINDLTIAIYAKEMANKLINNEDALAQIDKVVTRESAVSGDSVAVYQMDEHTGEIHLLPIQYGTLSDNNYLNEQLHEGNKRMGKLFDIEESLF